MVFNVCITASFALNKCQCAIPSTNCPCSVMRDPSIMIMVSYERRENELSNDVYIFGKIILNYWVMYPKTWVSLFQGHPVFNPWNKLIWDVIILVQLIKLCLFLSSRDVGFSWLHTMQRSNEYKNQNAFSQYSRKRHNEINWNDWIVFYTHTCISLDGYKVRMHFNADIVSKVCPGSMGYTKSFEWSKCCVINHYVRSMNEFKANQIIRNGWLNNPSYYIIYGHPSKHPRVSVLTHRKSNTSQAQILMYILCQFRFYNVGRCVCFLYSKYCVVIHTTRWRNTANSILLHSLLGKARHHNSWNYINNLWCERNLFFYQ